MHVSTIAAALAVSTLVACSDDGLSPAASETSSTGGEVTGDETVTATQGMTSSAGTTASTSVGTSASSADSGSDSDSGGFINPDDESGPTAPGPNGAQCASNEECDSMFCYTIPMVGGVCSECLMDADCEMGTCALDPTAMYAICTDGSIGLMCDSDEGCAGELVCTELIDTMGLFNASFCSDCGPSAPCEGDQVCAPVYDLGNFAGYFTCVEPGAVENGGGCPLEGGVGNDAACMSGHCGAVGVFMDLIQLGVCGECNVDEDCAAMMTCMPGTADMGGLMGSTCI